MRPEDCPPRKCLSLLDLCHRGAVSRRARENPCAGSEKAPLRRALRPGGASVDGNGGYVVSARADSEQKNWPHAGGTEEQGEGALFISVPLFRCVRKFFPYLGPSPCSGPYPRSTASTSSTIRSTPNRSPLRDRGAGGPGPASASTSRSRPTSGRRCGSPALSMRLQRGTGWCASGKRPVSHGGHGGHGDVSSSVSSVPSV
jgi:hypothetical protein